MTFYRVHCISELDGSRGPEWFTTRREAETLSREFLAEDEYRTAEVETVTVTPTKAGILLALKRYASYPDNG